MTSHHSGHRTDNLVIIAGGGIGGLATALTLHQIGVPCLVLEAVPEMRPLGVGINLQPNAVRELYELGFTRWELDRVGLPAKEWALVGLNGNDIYSEPRGLLAGYNWPQYAVHRGRFHVALYDKVVERIGPQAVQLGARVTGYARTAGGGVTALIERADGSASEAAGALLIGADGIHSAVRAQMHPAQPPIHWGGAVMWRGTTQARPIRTGELLRGARHPSPPHRALSDLPSRPADRPLDHQLDRRGDHGQHRGLEAGRLVPPGDERGVPAPLQGLGLGLARRARPAQGRRHRVREPHDRPRSCPHLGWTARWRCSAMPRTPCTPPAPTAAARRSSTRACWGRPWWSTG